jgi:hypothetical protein
MAEIMDKMERIRRLCSHPDRELASERIYSHATDVYMLVNEHYDGPADDPDAWSGGFADNH